MASDTLPFNTKIIRNAWENFKIFNLSLQKFSILNEKVRIYKELTTVMYNVRTHVFPQLLTLQTWKLHSKINAILLHIPLYFLKNPMKTFILYASLKIAKNPTNQPYNLYIYIPICFQFDRNLCKVLPK